MQPAASAWQVFGTRKCAETRKALRYFKERGVRVQEIDLAQRAMSPGELRKVAAQHGWLPLIDREGARFRDRGLAHSRLTDPDIERLLLEDPTLLRTPVVRRGSKSSVGYQPEIWQGWIAADKG
ncbi:MAG: ArsC/Spx/MgsR family protein [Polyangia bacterium]